MNAGIAVVLMIPVVYVDDYHGNVSCFPLLSSVLLLKVTSLDRQIGTPNSRSYWANQTENFEIEKTMIQAKYDPVPGFSPDLADQYDVITIGAGPAGASVGALLAEHGHSVLSLDRNSIPRFHVGESLIPETYWPLKRLGVLDQMKASSFPKKYSVQFVSDGHKESRPFYFDMHNTHESSQTWQIERADFDLMLLENAKAKGATIRANTQILEVLFDGDRAVGVKVKFTDANGAAVTKDIQSKVVVDCTGSSSFLSNRLKLRQADPLLKKATIWTYWENAHRDEGKDEGATIILQTEGKETWFWYIPLRDNIVSVGCTGSLSRMFPSGMNAEQSYQRELDRCPALARRLENATRVMDFQTTKDYSYTSSQAAGPGWVLCGDAYSFIDPVYSSGVYLALKGGEFVADAVHEALQSNDVSAEKLSVWTDEYNRGVEYFRKLVYAFYAPDFSFGTFFKSHPEYIGNLVDILVGAVFKEGHDAMFDAMGTVKPPADM